VQINAFNNVNAENIALGEHDGRLYFVVTDGDLGKSHVRASEFDRGSNTIEVLVLNLDSYVEKNGISHIDYLKIDVEGYELSVLKGARRTLEANPSMLIQMEAIETFSQRYGFSLASIRELMGEVGFAPYALDEEGRTLTRLESLQHFLDGCWGDVVWMHPQGTRRVAQVIAVRDE
jgi:FkbM family methyltransferase